MSRPRLAALAAIAIGALAAGLAAGAGAGGGQGEAAPARELSSSLALADADVPRFDETAAEAGIALPHATVDCSGNAAAAAWADVDDDGDVDLFLPQYAGLSRLWLSDGRGRFSDFAVAAGVADVPRATGASFADHDGDGDQDLYVVRHGANRLFENGGSARFRDVTAAAGVGDRGPGSAAAWGDFDRDGRLDLHVANGDNCGAPQPAPDRLYRNAGGGRFEDVTDRLGGHTDGVGLQAAWLDPDGDGDLDLYLANDHLGFRRNVLLRNERRGERFVAARSVAISSMGVGLGDLTGDGRIDLAVSDMGPPWVLSVGSRRARLPGPAGATWGVAIEDFDNDGDEDVLAAGGALGLRGEPVRDRLWLADGRGAFREVGARAGVDDPGRGRAVATADVDGDGLLDVLIARLGQRPLLLRNRGAPDGRRHGWLRLRLRGTRSPADACGARVGVRAGGRTLVRWVECGSEGFGSSSERVVHVGLGAARRYAAIEILWPSGRRQRLGPGRGQRVVEIVEPA